ncbi:hypothetical protein CAPTEDRAFT_105205, partial [Capitella teleta]
CYLDNEGQLTWEDAREHCVSLGGNLASVAGPDDQRFITELMLSSVRDTHWIGGNEIDRLSGWEWSDGSPFGYFFWKEGEPNDYGGRPEWCIHTNQSNAKWYDQVCTDAKASICKKSGMDIIKY